MQPPALYLFDDLIIHFLEEGYKIHSPRIEQSDWTVWMQYGTNIYIYIIYIYIYIYITR